MYYLAFIRTGKDYETPEVLTYNTALARDRALENLSDYGLAYVITGRTARMYFERALRRAYSPIDRLPYTLADLPSAYITDLAEWYKNTQAWIYDYDGVIH